MKKFALKLCLLIIIALSFCLHYNMACVSAETDTLNIVALGDSITTGYLLGGSTDDQTTKLHQSLFVNKIVANKNANLTNLAISGNKSSDLYQVICDSNNSTALTNADCILLTIGGNDILQPILSQLSIILNKNLTEASTSELAQAFALMQNDNEFLQSLTTATIIFSQNFEAINQQLRAVNANAQIIYQTVYNPAVKFEEDAQFSNFYSFIDTFIQQINNIISDIDNKTQYTYELCDTYTAFQLDASEEALTNIESFDIHPNENGNEVIYNTLSPLVKDKEILTNVTTIKIYTNNVFVNNPEDTSENQYEIGGTVADTTKDEHGFEILEVPVNGIKELKISTNDGFKLTQVFFGEKIQPLNSTYELNGDNLPNNISIHFLQKFTLTYSIGYNGHIVVDSEILNDPQENITKQVLYGGKSTCSISADYAYEIDTILIDEEETEISGINYNFENITENHTFAVTFKKIQLTHYKNSVYNIEMEASTDSLAYGTVLNISMLTSGEEYKEITEIIDKYSKKFRIYNFSLKLGNLSVQPNGNFTIRIPMPDNYNKDKVELYYISDTNEKEQITYTVDENNMLVFQTDHCSYYVIVERGEIVKNYWWAYVIIASLAVVTAVVTTVILLKKKQDKKIEQEIREKSLNDYISY